MSRQDKILNLFNETYYIFKRNNWMLDIKRYFNNFGNIEIDRPIFLLGTHGGGLTLVSRMLRRNQQVVSITGNSKYWSGADEMQVVFGSILPTELSGIKHNLPPHPIFGAPRGWLYATDELIKYYRKSEKDFNINSKKKLEKIIRYSIYRHATNKNNSRFTDKSQVFTVKVSFINKLLEEYNPMFILITRNPYAICFRSAMGKAGGLKAIEDKFNFNERLAFAAEHWANSMKYALIDKKKIKHLLIIRFEDILKEPEKYLKKICNFLELEFNNEMLPQPKHTMPFGSKFRDRWYPLRPDVNQIYLNEIKREHIEIIASRCEKYANIFDYEKIKK